MERFKDSAIIKAEGAVDAGEVAQGKGVETSIEEILNEVSAIEKSADTIIGKMLQIPIAPEKAQDFKEKVIRTGDRFKARLRELSRSAVLGTALLSTMVPQANPETAKESRERARIELTTKGITAEQHRAYILGFNDLIYRAIVPRSYTANSYAAGEGFRTAREVVEERRLEIVLAIFERAYEGLKKERFIETPQREDAWRMYLGLPQTKNSFSVSEYMPTRSKETKYYYKFNDPTFLLKSYTGDVSDSVKRVVTTLEEFQTNSYVSQDSVVLGSFQWSKGVDEKGAYIAYYDIWDLNVPIEKDGVFGKPFEVYDRIYYDPVTYRVVP